MSKHTPGPWTKGQRAGPTIHVTGPRRMGNTSRVYKHTPGNIVAYVSRGSDDAGDADANLIAAAPDLLEALRVALVQVVNTGSETDDIHREVCAMARAAIAKAEGRS